LDKVTTIQQIVARTYTRKLIDRITGQPGKVWIEFNDINPEDEAKVAEWIAKLRTGVDPDAICYAAWVQERLGIPPNPEEEEEDDEPAPPQVESPADDEETPVMA
jgi:phage gp29-like protein